MPSQYRDRTYLTDAVVLRRVDYGEADRILDVYTPEFGKLDVIAKGARKAQSRSGPYLDVCSWVQLDLARGRDLDVVRSATSIRRFPRLATDLEAFGYANYFAELVRSFTEPAEPHAGVYELLTRSLVLIDDGLDPWIITRHFELALLGALGYHPEFFTCVGCNEPIAAQVNAFSAAHGGFLCPNCRQTDPAAIPLSVNAQKYLRLVQRDGLAAAFKVQPSPAERIEIQNALLYYVRFLAERDMRSLDVLRDVQAGPDLR